MPATPSTSPNASVYLSEASWSGTTWTSSSGGPIMAEFSIDGEVVRVRSGDDQYPRAVLIPSRDCKVTLRLLEVKTTAAAVGAAAGSLVLKLVSPAPSTSITFATMVPTGIRGSQAYAKEGTVEITFEHESAGGTANPVS